MLNIVAALLGLIFLALVYIARDLAVIAKARRLDIRRKGMCESVIGFGPTVIKANETATFMVEPASDYEGERLIVPSSLANNFAITDMLVGGHSQAVSGNPIPAAAFSELAVGVNLNLGKANKSKPITLKVLNSTDRDQTFCAALIGLTAKDAERHGRAQLVAA